MIEHSTATCAKCIYKMEQERTQEVADSGRNSNNEAKRNDDRHF